MRDKSRRAQTQNLAPAMIALVLAAMFLVFGLIMTQELRDTDAIDKVTQETVLNETETRVINETPIYVDGTLTGYGGNSFVLTSVDNGTTDITGNFSMTSTGQIYFTGTTAINNNTANRRINYTYWRGDEAYLGANKSLSGMATFADFWEIIVLAIVISVVIGLLLIVFASRSNR